MPIAITRPVSPSITRCELTHLQRQPIDLELARIQHAAYESCLAQLGCVVQRLPVEPELPDAVFVEDIAIVFAELAVITRPGAASRRPEIPSVAQALMPYRELYYIDEPGTLDGGDVLRLGQTLYVGLSGRSNPVGLEQLHRLVAPYGYSIKWVAVSGCLHLKSAVTQVAEDTLLINPEWISAGQFGGMKIITVDPSEPHAGNALLVNGTVLVAAAYPATQARLEAAGIPLVVVDVTELAKAEGALTCCSLIFEI
jgi:dimethylargininase